MKRRLDLQTFLGAFRGLPKLLFCFSVFSFVLASTVSAQKTTVCGYEVTLQSVTPKDGQTTIVYAVKNTKPGNGSGDTFKDLSHFGFVLPPCVKVADIKSGGSYGVDKSQNCLPTAYLKFDYGTKGTNITYYTLVLNGTYVAGGTTTAVFKAGTGCCKGSIPSFTCAPPPPPCTPPKCEITGSRVICIVGSNPNTTTLSGPSGTGLTYKWTGPNSFTSTSQSITVNSSTGSSTVAGPGKYTLTVTNAGKCSSTCYAEVTVVNTPVCDITGKDKICEGQSTSFTATGGTKYSWTGPGGFTAYTATISGLKVPGVYKVTVSNGSCSVVCEKTLIVDKLDCAIEGKGVICNDGSTIGSTVLKVNCGSGYFTYKWTAPDGTITNSQSITIHGSSLGGLYKVEVTNANGCTKTLTKNVTVENPACEIKGDNYICSGGKASLTASGGVKYSWTGPGGFTASTPTISGLTVPGTYTVTLETAGGCVRTCNKTIVTGVVPSCSISGDADIMEGETTSFTASGGDSYSWTGPNGFTATGATINGISKAGTYTVTVTSSTGCKSTCSVVLKVTPKTPPPTDCGYIVKLESVTYVNGQTKFVWSVYNPKPGNGTNGTYQDLSHFGFELGDCVDLKDIKSGGSYGVDKSQNCYVKPYLKFDYGTSGTKKTYYTLVLNGKYTVGTTLAVFKAGQKCCTTTVQGVGCKETSCIPPKCEIYGKRIICFDGSNPATTKLCGPSYTGYTYKWTGPNGFTATTRTIEVNSSTGTATIAGPGVYTLTVTNAQGCTSTCTAEVVVNRIPVCSITGNTEICFDGSNQSSTTLTGPSGYGFTYKWEGPNGYTVTTKTVQVNSSGTPGNPVPGVYKLTVTDKYGCSSTCQVEVTTKNCPTTSVQKQPEGVSLFSLDQKDASAAPISVSASPNPFQDRVRFVIQSKISGQGVLEVYNMAGAKVKTVFQGYIQAGRDQVVEYSAKGAPKQNLIYRMQVGGKQVTGKLVNVQ